MLEPRDQLFSLLRIQELANEIREAQRTVDGAPQRIEESEQRFRERNAEYVALKERNDELEHDQRTRSSELAVLEEHRAKYMSDLMQVKNQREYAAMLNEIDTVKAQIAGHEEAILRDLEEIEKLKGELRGREEHIAVERETVARERKEVEAVAAEAQRLIEARSAERHEVEAALPAAVRAAIRRLEPRRQGIFLARTEKGTCESCFVRVRPQVFQEIKAAAAVHTCDSCKRFLYHPSLAEPQTEAPPADNVEAVNGGAV